MTTTDQTTRLATAVAGRQMALLSKPMVQSAYGLPLWSLVICWAFAGDLPFLGQVAPVNFVTWFILVCLVSGIAIAAEGVYRADAAQPATFDAERWVPRTLTILAMLSSAWASVCWFFWIPGNEVNNLVLAILVLAGVMNGIVARMTWFSSYMAGAGISFLLLLARCATSDSEVAHLVGSIAFAVFFIVTGSVRTASRQIEKNIAAQIENEWLKEENTRARDEAERASRLKSEFLANMSHELRTPLNAILGFSEVISAQHFGPNAAVKYRDYANHINSSGKHLLGMINDLLDVAKIEAGKMELYPEWIDADAALEQATRFIEERAAAKGLRIEVVVQPGSQSVWVDERAFMQVSINLLSNALKFTDRGSISVHLHRDGNASILRVTDTGCGIAADRLPHVFEAFEQADNSYTSHNRGTGLGLTLVRALVTLHGGTSAITSEEGIGTEVTVSFPLPVPEEAQDPSVEAVDTMERIVA
jgi:two-component system cell cycle sensor histidine kinase PleC